MAVDREHDHKSEAQNILGRTLAALRKREGMSQTELAARVGIRRQGIARIERSAEYCSITTLKKIAKELDEPLSRIMKYTEKIEGNA
jgi:transcriptional regulator with XRE-family HTH domain